MHHATAARNELGPLLEQLIRQLSAEGRRTQQAYFSRIKRRLEKARHDAELANPIRELSTTTLVGFEFSTDADALINRIVEKSHRVARQLEPTQPIIH